MRLVVLLSGRGSNFIALQQHIQRRQLPIEIALVVSDKADATGLRAAEDLGIATAHVARDPKTKSSSQFQEELLQMVLGVKPDLVVLAGFMRVLGPEFIRPLNDRIINIHPSLLPSFPGTHAQRQALAAGVKFSGCTVHVVIEAVDAGPILAQAVVPVLPGDDEESLAARILIQEHLILPAVVQAFAEKSLTIVAGVPKWADTQLVSAPDNAWRSIASSPRPLS